MSNKKLLPIALTLLLPSLALADTPSSLLKRTDIKSYEGFLQVTPNESPKVDLNIDFIKPTFDYRPITSGAMVGLIQRGGSLDTLTLNFAEQCSGEVSLKIGIKEFNGHQYGHIASSWSMNTYSNKISFKEGKFKAKDNETVEGIETSAFKSLMTKGTPIIIKMPVAIPYQPGDILVLEEIVYTTSEDRKFNPCTVQVKEK
jgi:hypothetical protein